MEENGLEFEKNINVQIMSEQYLQNETPQVIKYMTSGILKRTKTAWEIIYKEPKEQGFSDSVTTVVVGDNNKITMDRVGAYKMNMLFDRGTAHISRMNTPYGQIDIQFLTEEIISKIDETGGSIYLSYLINHKDDYPIKTSLDILISVK